MPVRANGARLSSKAPRKPTADTAAAVQQRGAGAASGMSPALQSAIATVVLLGTVMLLMGSSLRQASHSAVVDVASHAAALKLPTDATRQKPGQAEALYAFRQQQARRAAALPVATVEEPAPVATVEAPPVFTALDEPSCLMTKWGAVWLMTVAKHERWHVQHPTDECEPKALTVVDESLDKFPKAHGGLGPYALDVAQSKAACNARPCEGKDLPRGSVAQPKLPAEKGDDGQDEFAALHEPPNGWGMGVHPEWRERSSLRFNEAAKTSFSSLSLEAGQPLLLVFGGASVNDMLRNWAIHVQRLKLPYAVACMDEKLFNLADDFGMPGVMMIEKSGEDKKVTTRWKYFRMDPKAFMTMGILKVRFFIEFLKGGFDVLCADLDVIWLRDPTPWVTGVADKSALLLSFADVTVSTDVTHGGADADQHQWGMQQEMNTGMLLLRSSAGAMAVCQSWVERMQQEMVSIAKLPSSMLQWWSNDQTFFNEVVHRAALEMTVKAQDARGRAQAEAWLNGTARHPAKRQALEAAIAKMNTLRATGLAEYRALRGIVIKKIRRPSALVSASIATFPFLQFASGHTYFTQSLQPRLGFVPVAVHTTFQFGDTAEFAWGKRSRLRERLLWEVDSADYYAFSGEYSPGKGAVETGYGGFVQIVGELMDPKVLAAPLPRAEAAYTIKLEGMRSFVDRSLAAKGDVHKMDRGNPNYHLILDSYQRRLVHDAMALGSLTKRKVIMPKLLCWVDRYWNNLVDGRFPGVTAQQHPLPFHCPFDHLFDLEKWVHMEAHMREYSFLDNPHVTDAQRNDSVFVRVEGAASSGADAVPPEGARVLTMKPGDNYAAVKAALVAKGWEGAYVLKVDARSLELLCEDLGSPEANSKFNTIMHTVLGIAEQVRFCDTKVNPRYNGRQDDYNNPINCTWGFHRPPQMGNAGDGASCSADPVVALTTRNQEPSRNWNTGRREAWSTRDRAGYLYRNYM